MASTPELFARAVAQYQGGNPTLAELLCREILRADPKHAPSHQMLGMLAHAAGQDPLEFRLKLIGESRKIPQFGEGREEYHPLDTGRLKGVLELAAAKAGWNQPLPKGQGRGIAGFRQAFAAEPTVVKPDYGKWILGCPRINFAAVVRASKGFVSRIPGKQGRDLN